MLETDDDAFGVKFRARRTGAGDSKSGHTLHLLTSAGGGVEGAWQENLDGNSRGELPCDQPGR